MWPNSPAMPFAPRSTRPSSRTAPPIPVPMVIISADAAPRAAPYVHSARAAQLASLSRATGTAEPVLEVCAERLSLPWQVGGEHDPLPRRVDEPGSRDSDSREGLAVGCFEHGLDQGVLDLTYDDAAAGRGAAAGTGDAPLVVDNAGEHLGAADVDADVDPTGLDSRVETHSSSGPLVVGLDALEVRCPLSSGTCVAISVAAACTSEAQPRRGVPSPRG